MGAIAPCPVGEIDTWVKELDGSGTPVLALNVGEPSLSTDEHIMNAAAAACRSRRLQRSTPAAGLPELRQAVASKTARDWNLDVSASEVVVTSGGKQGVFGALSAVVDPGDEVLVPSPYLPTHPVAVELAGGRPVSVPASMEDGFKVTVDRLEAALSPRTKALIMCSPCNPTGAVYTPEELRDIGRWAAEEDLWVVSDEVYEHLVFGDAVATSLPSLVPEVRDHCIVLNSVAVAYSMMGWRVGWLIAPARVAEAIRAFQSHATSHASNVAQAAAVAALEGGPAPVERLRADLDRRRLRLCAALSTLTEVDMVEPQGGLYAFPSVEAYLGRRVGGRPIATTLELCAVLVKRAGVAVVPGEAFGRLGHVRVSFGLPDEELEEGIARVVTGLEDVMKGRS
jgi:aspartate/methionine/tyrosine aminotransferase